MKFVIILVLVFLSSCKYQDSKIKQVRLQDTTTIREKKAYYKRVQDYKFFYFYTVYAGKYKDKILLPSKVQFFKAQEAPFYDKMIADLESQPIEMYVDTSYRGYFYQQKEDSHYKAAYIQQALIIRNKTKDTLYTTPEPNISIEAKDSVGDWRVLEPSQTCICGSGFVAKFAVIPPKGLSIVYFPVYRGIKKTKLRLRLGKHVSNEFDGEIDPKQLKYKREYYIPTSFYASILRGF